MALHALAMSGTGLNNDKTRCMQQSTCGAIISRRHSDQASRQQWVADSKGWPPTFHAVLVVSVPPHEAALAAPRIAGAGDRRAAQLDALLQDV
jgi:hypothetical protein